MSLSTAIASDQSPMVSAIGDADIVTKTARNPYPQGKKGIGGCLITSPVRHYHPAASDDLFPAGGAGVSTGEAGHPGCRSAVARHVQWLFPDGGHCRCHRDASRCRDWSPGFGHWHLFDRGFRGFVAPLAFAADGCPAE